MSGSKLNGQPVEKSVKKENLLLKYLVQKPRQDSENLQKITHINFENLHDKNSENLQKISYLNFENLQQKDLTEKNTEEPEARKYPKKGERMNKKKFQKIQKNKTTSFFKFTPTRKVDDVAGAVVGQNHFSIPDVTMGGDIATSRSSLIVEGGRNRPVCGQGVGEDYGTN